MSAPVKAESQIEEGIAHVDTGYPDEKKGGLDKAGAIEAENAEHNMGVLQAVRAYPMASLWAFVMSCTIVSSSLRTRLLDCFLLFPYVRIFVTDIACFRSWSRTVCS